MTLLGGISQVETWKNKLFLTTPAERFSSTQVTGAAAEWQPLELGQAAAVLRRCSWHGSARTRRWWLPAGPGRAPCAAPGRCSPALAGDAMPSWRARCWASPGGVPEPPQPPLPPSWRRGVGLRLVDAILRHRGLAAAPLVQQRPVPALGAPGGPALPGGPRFPILPLPAGGDGTKPTKSDLGRPAGQGPAAAGKGGTWSPSKVTKLGRNSHLIWFICSNDSSPWAILNTSVIFASKTLLQGS